MCVKVLKFKNLKATSRMAKTGVFTTAVNLKRHHNTKCNDTT